MNYEEAVTWQNHKGIQVFDVHIANCTSVQEAIFIRRIAYLWDRFKEEHPEGVFLIPNLECYKMGIHVGAFNKIITKWINLKLLHMWQGGSGNKRYYVLNEEGYANYLTMLLDICNGKIDDFENYGLAYMKDAKSLIAEEEAKTPVCINEDTETKPNTPVCINEEAVCINEEAVCINEEAVCINKHTSVLKLLHQCQKISTLYSNIRKYIKLNKKYNKGKYKSSASQIFPNNSPSKPVYDNDSPTLQLTDWFFNDLIKRSKAKNTQYSKLTDKGLTALKQKWCIPIKELMDKYSEETIVSVLEWLSDTKNYWYAQHVVSTGGLKDKFENCLHYMDKIPIENEDWCWVMSNAFIQLNDIQNYVYTRADIKKNYEEAVKKMFRYFERKNVLPQKQIDLTFECLNDHRPKGVKHEEWILKHTKLWNGWMIEDGY